MVLFKRYLDIGAQTLLIPFVETPDQAAEAVAFSRYPPDHPGYRALLDLVDSGRVGVKLSAPYETSKLGPPHYMDVGRLARGLIQAAP